MPLLDQLRDQRLTPLTEALGVTALGLPLARRLIVLPSRATAGIPVEVLLAPGDSRMVSYAPSGTVFKYLRERPRPDRHAGLWPWATRSTSVRKSRAIRSRRLATACWSTWSFLARMPRRAA